MSHTSPLIKKNIRAYLRNHETKTLLRFITCGSVDDGKSTLIGRLLYDSKMIFVDQLRSLEMDSARFGTQGQDIDFALLVDGLAAEREQGITIDVAYRFFSTEKRKFIVADTPGHEQYTRNMVTGASTADLAIVLIDVRKGVLTQTKRHTFLAKLLGIKQIVLAVNKMDLIEYDQKIFDKIVKDYSTFISKLGIEKFVAIPISALKGENITNRSGNSDWYMGPTLMGYLETVAINKDSLQNLPARFPIQWVNRPNQDFRGFTGTVASGKISSGDIIKLMPSGKITRIKEIILYKDTLVMAVTGQAVTIILEDEIDVSRGDVFCDSMAPPSVADQFQAQLVWMSEEPMHPGRSYWLKCGTKIVNATATQIKFETNINTLEKLASKNLNLNAVATCNFSTDEPIVFDPYVENRAMGGFILIDKLTNNTVAAGMIEFALHRSQNIIPYNFGLNKEMRAAPKNQIPKVFWFTGLPGSGKSTIANLFEQKLHEMGRHTFILDGDSVRHGLNKDLGFTTTDRVENIRRIAEVSKLMVEAGLIVIVATISPFMADRAMARSLFKEGEFFEVYVNTPMEIAEQRDPKGLYIKARNGQIKNFTGIDSKYEPPNNPEIIITPSLSQEEIIAKLISYL